MGISKALDVINEMIAHGTSPKGRKIMGGEAVLIEFHVDQSELHQVTLQGEELRATTKKIPVLKVSVTSQVLADIHEGRLNPQEAQLLGALKLNGAVRLARLVQRATQWGLA